MPLFLYSIYIYIYYGTTNNVCAIFPYSVIITRDLQLEYCKGTINYVNEYTYVGVKITKVGNHEPEINDRINRGRVAITKLNSILWDRDVTPKTKTHIYHSIVKSTITYAAET